MGEKGFANEGCDEGFKEGVQKMVEVLVQGYIQAKTASEKKQALDRFQKGLAIYKDAYEDAQKAIEAVFT